MSELVKKSDVLDIWNTYWHTSKLSVDEAETKLKELSIDQPQLNHDQQIVFNWLKSTPLLPISAIYLLEAGKNVPATVKEVYENFGKDDELQLLAAFARWGQERSE